MSQESYFKTASELFEATATHEKYRGQECLNLIASEGIKSPAVREMLCLSQDLESRYAEGENDPVGHVKVRHYQGQKYMTKIEDHTADIMKALFGCNWVDVRLVSGTHANLATFKGLSMATKNNKMVVTPLMCGAHISHDYTGLAGRIIGLENIVHCYSLEKMNIDPDESARIIRAARPGIVTFGGSLYLFPHPIKELSDVAKEVGAYVVYDAAHVLGLIAGGPISRSTQGRRRLHDGFNPQNFSRAPRRSNLREFRRCENREGNQESSVRRFSFDHFEHSSWQASSLGLGGSRDETLRGRSRQADS